MAVNANGFNSRITSEALEARFREVFPAQAGAELIQDLYASGVIVPTIDFTSIAEGSFLPESLQQAWDISTGSARQSGAGSTTVINNTGFWKVDLTTTMRNASSSSRLTITDGLSSSTVWDLTIAATSNEQFMGQETFIVFLKSGESLVATNVGPDTITNVWYRQVASVNGVLVNPLGFTF